ncbi:MAG: hypothetical protein EOO10_10760, partial [Chitinophagaceae bacterium]
MAKLFLRISLFLISLVQGVNTAQAQNGDQILDGIGETGMIARYVFNGDLREWSRNNLHSKLVGGEAAFVNDVRFGRVLSLPGDNNVFVSLPSDALTNLESLSISGWIYLRSKQPGQRFFDFGKDASRHFFAAPVGTTSQEGFQSVITFEKSAKKGALAPVIETNKWVHLAVVIDIPSKTMTTYVESKPVGETKDIPKELTEVFGQQPGEKMLYIGKSLVPGDPYLDALVSDFRIYRIPLTVGQVAGIYNHSQRGRGVNEGTANTNRRRAEDTLPRFSPATAQLYNNYLVGVSDVNVETEVGNLPRLPAYIPASYNNKVKGSKVRVLWPAPTDNSGVLKPGNFTVTGRIPGTDFQPKAFVIVKAAKKATAPGLKLATFNLNQVSLQTTAQGSKSKFIENRDKFVNTLAKTDPNSFLYMFRHAFGQKQPEGAKPLGVWDSRATKLRGHATGHYLTAIAQAYASTGYDKTLQNEFAQKMDYMVNTLYELSQLSGKPKEGNGSYVSDPAAVPPGPGKTGYDSDLSDTAIRNDYWNWGKGFISAYPPDQFIMLEKGAKYGGQKNQIWAPYYTLHKILAGLLDVYEVSGNKKALEIASGMGNWVYTRLSKVPTDTLIKMWNTYIAGEFGGMNEVMARMYRITGKSNHLKTAQLFDNIRVFFGDTAHTHGLAKNVDLFRGLHANQHIPQAVGSIETYRVTSNPEYFKVADNFWYKMVNDYMYSIGGVAGARNPANAECFTAQPGTLYENGFA